MKGKLTSLLEKKYPELYKEEEKQEKSYWPLAVIILSAVLSLAGTIGVIYVILHFISKYW